MKRALWLALVTIGVSFSDAAGQAVSDLKVTVFGGGSFAGMSRTFTVDDADDFYTTDFRSGLKIGVRVGKGLSDRWALEGAYSYGRNNLRVVEMQAPGEARIFKMTNQQVSGNAMLYAGVGEDWKPFVTGGLGFTRFNPTQEAMALATVRFLDNSTQIQADSKWTVNFGGGAEFGVSDSIGIRADLRDHMTQIPRFGIRPTSDGSGSGFYPVTGWGHTLEFSVGVVFSIPLR